MGVVPANDFLFVICEEIKLFYETPVIFITEKNYSENIFNALCQLRAALLEVDPKSEIIDIIVEIHLQWIHVVNDIDNYKKRLNDVNIPREEVYQAISYTIDAMNNRLKHFQRYLQVNRLNLTNAEQANLNAELEIIEEMHTEVTRTLLEKLTCFRAFPSDDVFKIYISDNVEELLNWFDKLNNNLLMQICKYLDLDVSHLNADLTKALQQIVYEFINSDTSSAHKMLDDLKQRGAKIGTMIRCITPHSLEMSKIVEKINVIENHIKNLENDPTSAAVKVLIAKKKYLESRLVLLENLKTTLLSMHNEAGVRLKDFEQETEEDLCICEDFFTLRIFNHYLPLEEREKLVTQLCYLWDLAMFGERSRKSMISILSAADIKEEFTDELGTFFIDEHSRKIYKLPADETLYQPNESNELVPLSDDAEHIFFYDECGRYFIDTKTRQRVYKDHATASEYMMDTSGVLLKTKEVRDGVVYYYDNYGRYYINESGKNIYRDPDAISEYENDGLGNLVRIRSHVFEDIFEPCPDDANVTEDFKYLKQAVGPALRACIAQCILHQPADPIKFLSSSLIKFRENMEIKEKREREKEELFAEREIIIAKERAAAAAAAAEAAAKEETMLAQGGSECSYDSNLLNYTTDIPGDVLSATSK